MRVLALDGALGGFSAAIVDGKTEREFASGRPDALEAGLGHVSALLSAAGLTIRDVDRVGVGIGPGSFTGVRIALSYAKALALAVRRPLAGISSYDVLTPEEVPGPVLTVVQGRPGVIAARLRRGTETLTAAGHVSDVLETLLADWKDGELALAGNTEDVSFALAERGIVVHPLSPRAGSPALNVARLALHAVPAATVHAVAPDYGELPAVVVRATS